MIYLIRYALIALYTIFWGTPAVILGLLGRGDAVVWIGRQWVRWILATCRIRVEATGLEHIDPARPTIFMSNHQSAVDIAALLATLPVQFRFVAKRELTRIPFFGWALAVSGHIIIDRQNREKAIRSLDRAAERVRAGTHVIVYPEGTRTVEASLGTFKSGGFYLAIHSQVPIVPVTVSGSRRITPKGSLRVESGRVRIHYGAPIQTEKLGIEDRAELKERVRKAILAGFDPELHSFD